MRLFVALPVPSVVRDAVWPALAGVREDPRLAWTRPEGWHVTLGFLGEVEGGALSAVVATVEEGVAAAGVGAVTVRTGPARRLARRTALVLELVDEPGGALEALGAGVQQALVAADLPVQVRPVRPHLTLARARRRRPVPDEVLEAVDVPSVRWDAVEVAVVESVRGDGPAAYPTRASVPLVG